jgi:hypothetical protein
LNHILYYHNSITMATPIRERHPVAAAGTKVPSGHPTSHPADECD